MNLDLYFKKFEDEIKPEVEAPETGADIQPDPVTPATDPADDDLDLEDIASL